MNRCRMYARVNRRQAGQGHPSSSGTLLAAELLVPQLERALCGERQALRPLRVGRTQSNMSIPAAHRLQDVPRHAHAHQVPRPVGRQLGHQCIQHRHHLLVRLADRQPADGVAGKVQLHQPPAHVRSAGPGQCPPCTMPNSAWSRAADGLSGSAPPSAPCARPPARPPRSRRPPAGTGRTP